MKAVLYLRVSTDEQNVDPQRLELREVCARRGYTIVEEIEEKASGASTSRAGLDRMMKLVRKRSVQVVVCAKLDRLGRSLQHLVQIIGELDTAGVALICQGQGIDTSQSNPAGRLQMHVLMAVAEFERSLIKDRTKAGLRAAVANGKTLGRPASVPDGWWNVVAVWRKDGGTIRALATTLGVSVGTAHKLAKATP